MKGIRKHIAVILMTCASLLVGGVGVNAQTVSESSAKAIAETFAKNKMGGAGSVSLAAQIGGGSVYVFNIGTKGFVVVSGDSRAEAVLGYSMNGNYVPSAMPSQMSGWLQGYSSQVRMASRLPESAAQSGNRAGGSRAAISPLIATTWNQNAPYNADCPGGALTGCVAVAMGQVMRYTICPNGNMSASIDGYTDGNGASHSKLSKTSFAWALMLNSYTSASEVGAEEVAKLLHYCANSVNSTYGTTATGAYVNFVSNALYHYFGYDADVRMVWRKDYTYDAWEDLIYAELSAGRPVIYRGASSAGGHTFICDGYDGSLFHINWGWGGSGDGYYSLSALLPTSGGDGTEGSGYNSNQAAVIGIQAEDGVQTFVKKLVSESISGTVDGSGTLTVNCSYLNDCGARGKFVIGLGAIDDAGNLLTEVETFRTLNMDYGVVADYESSIPVLSAGTYKLALIGRMDSETEWRVLDNWETKYITVVSDGTKYISVEEASPATGIEISAGNFPDDNFREYVKATFDLDNDDYLNDDEIAAVEGIYVDEVTDFTGLSYFTELTDLVSSYGTFSTIDLSKNTKLIFLSLDNNANLTGLDLSACSSLASVYLAGISSTSFKSLDLRGISTLEDVTLEDCENIETLKLSGLPALNTLYVSNCKLASLDVSSLSSLTSLGVSGSSMSGIKIEGLNSATNIEELTLNELGLSSLDVSALTNLGALYVANNMLSSLDLTANTAITMGNLSPQTIITPADGKVIGSKVCILIPGWEGKTIAASSLSNAKIVGGNSLTPEVIVSDGDSYLVVSNDPTEAASLEGKKLTYVYSTGHSSTSVKSMSVSLTIGSIDVSGVCMGVSLTAENFPDDVFRTYVSENIDENSDGCLTETEIADNAKAISLSGVASLKGIELLGESVESLTCTDGSLTTVDFSGNNFKQLTLDGNAGLTSLDLSSCTNLEALSVNGTGVTSLDLTGLTKIVLLSANNTGMSLANIKALPTTVEALSLKGNSISSVDLSDYTALTVLDLSDNSLAELDLSKNTALATLELSGNSLTYLDMTGLSVETFSGSESVASLDGLVLDGKIGLPMKSGWEVSNVSGLKVNGVSVSTPKTFVDGGVTYLVISEDESQASALQGKPVTYSYSTGNTPSQLLVVVITTGVFEVAPCSGVELNATNFPDDALRAAISTQVNIDNNDCLSTAEIDGVTALTFDGIADLTGLEFFPELTELHVANSTLGAVDLSSNSKLKVIDLQSSSCSSIDMSALADLEELTMVSTSVTSPIDLTANTKLTTLTLENATLPSVDLSGISTLTEVAITNVDASKVVGLEGSIASLQKCVMDGGNLESFDATAFTSLTQLSLQNNHLLSLDLAGRTIADVKLSGQTATIDGKVLEGQVVIPVPSSLKTAQVSDMKVDGADMACSSVEDGGQLYLVISSDPSAASELEGKTVTYSYETGNTPAAKLGVAITIGTIDASAPCSGVAVTAANFPDAKLLSYVTENVDTNSDGCLSDDECLAVSSMTLSGVADITGLEHFTNLLSLTVEHSTLTSVDLSANTKLKDLNLEDGSYGDISVAPALLTFSTVNSNVTTAVDLTSCTSLFQAHVYNSDIVSVDLSGLSSLEVLYASGTDLAKIKFDGSSLQTLTADDCGLTEFDASAYPSLTSLSLNDNHLTKLDLSGRSIATVSATGQTVVLDGKVVNGYVALPVPSDFEYLKVSDMKVDGVSYASVLFDADGQTYLSVSDDPSAAASLEGKTVTYSYDTGNTPTALLTMTMTIGTIDASAPCSGVALTAANFPDASLLEYLAANVDANSDNCLSDDERAAVSVLNLPDGLTSLQGIEHFTEVKTLTSKNATFSEVDLSANTKLTSLSLGSPNLASVDLSAQNDIQVVILKDCNLTTLDLSGKTDLNSVVVSGNKLTSIDLTGSTSLASLDISGNENLSLSNISGFASLTGLQTLFLADCGQTSLDLSAQPGLLLLDARNNHLQTLDLSGKSITTVNLTGQTAAVDGKVVDGEVLIPVAEGFDVSNVSSLNVNGADVATAETRTVDGVVYLYLDDAGAEPKALEGKDVTYEYETGNTPSAKLSLRLTIGSIDASAGTDPVCTGVEVTAANFPDATFLQYVKDKVDTDADLCLTTSEVAAVTSIDLEAYTTAIADLTGIELFTNLTSLNAKGQTLLKNVNLSANTKLETLKLGGQTTMATLDLSENIALQSLEVANVPLTKLNISNCLSLEDLILTTTQLSSLDMTTFVSLKALDASNNAGLKTLDVSSCTALTTLNVANTGLSSLQVPPSVTTLNADNCHLTSLSLSATGVADGTASAWTQTTTAAMRKLSDGSYGIKMSDAFDLSATSDMAADGASFTGEIVTEGSASYIVVGANKDAADLLNGKTLEYKYNTGRGLMLVRIGLGYSSSGGGIGSGTFWICP